MVRNLVCVITVIAIATAGCTSMHKVPVMQGSGGQQVWQVKAGDTIRVTLKDGASAQFEVQAVTPDAIVAMNGMKYEHANITSVERRAVSGGKTAGAAVAGVGVTFVLLMAAASAVLISMFSGGGR